MNFVGDARTNKNSVAEIYGIDLNVFVFYFSGRSRVLIYLSSI